MELKLTRAERILLFQIVNVKLDMATLRDHLMLEKIYNSIDAEGAQKELPRAIDFAKEEDKPIFEKYDGIRISDIEDQKEQAIIVEALTKAREKENEIWSNAEDPDFVVKFEDDQIKIINDFFEKDKRTWPRNYHKAIISLHEKLTK